MTTSKVMPLSVFIEHRKAMYVSGRYGGSIWTASTLVRIDDSTCAATMPRMPWQRDPSRADVVRCAETPDTSSLSSALATHSLTLSNLDIIASVSSSSRASSSPRPGRAGNLSLRRCGRVGGTSEPPSSWVQNAQHSSEASANAASGSMRPGRSTSEFMNTYRKWYALNTSGASSAIHATTHAPVTARARCANFLASLAST